MDSLPVQYDDFLKVELQQMGSASEILCVMTTEQMGKFQRHSFTLKCNNVAPLFNTFYLPIGAAQVFTVMLKPVGSYTDVGSFYGRVSIAHGNTAAAQIDDVLMCGIFTNGYPLRFPQLNTNIDVLAMASHTPTSAAAPGTFEYTFTAPDDIILQPISVSWVLTTDINVANRQAALIVSDDVGNQIFNLLAGTIVPASTVSEITFVVNFAPGTSSAVYQPATMPNILIFPGWTIKAYTYNAQAGDVITNVVLDAVMLPAN